MTKDISNAKSCNSQWNHDRYEFRCPQTQVQMRKDLQGETDTLIMGNFNKPLWWKQINKKYINYLGNINRKFIKVYLIVTYWTLYYNKRICSFFKSHNILIKIGYLLSKKKRPNNVIVQTYFLIWIQTTNGWQRVRHD